MPTLPLTPPPAVRIIASMQVAPMLAFGLPGHYELLVLGVIGVLMFGRRLPEVGRQIGKAMTQLRRGLQDFKDQINEDEDLRDAKSAIKDIKKSLDAPGALTDPKRVFEQLTEEAMSSPGPDSADVEPPPTESVFEEEAKKLASQGAAEPDEES